MGGSLGFHAFRYEGKVYSGPVTTFESSGGIVRFSYSYVVDGVTVVGSFAGEAADNGAVEGVWKDLPETPIRGKSAWQGSASLGVIEANGRRSLFGSWMAAGKSPARWMIEVSLAVAEAVLASR
jgi:hypothetical protein